MDEASGAAGGGEVGFFHPSTKAYRYTLLGFVALLMFGSYFAYDSIGALATQICDELGVGRATVGSLYAAYSIAAVFVVFFGGILVDRLGTRKASLIFCTLVALGTLIVALAHDVWLLFLGRFLFGAGSETLIVAQSAILARWFRGKELALSFGITLTIARLGTYLAFNLSGVIADHFGSMRYALWTAFAFCVLSLLANFVYNVMDAHGQKILRLAEQEGDKVVFADIRKFPATYWYVTLLCLTFYSAIFPFTDLATDMFQQDWGLPLAPAAGGTFFDKLIAVPAHMFDTATGITSIVIFASMCCAWFAGGVIDRVGRRASLMIVGSLVIIPCHLVLGLTSIYPAAPMAFLGVAFVLVPAALWPSIPLLVDKNRVGTAFGLTTAIQNVGLAAFPYLNGYLRDTTGSYTPTQVMFASLGFVGLLFAILLLRADRRAGGLLERATTTGC